MDLYKHVYNKSYVKYFLVVFNYFYIRKSLSSIYTLYFEYNIIRFLHQRF